MKIIRKQEARQTEKPEGTKVDYYLRPEYEVHFNEQAPNTTQTWHHHEKITETLFIIEGELTAEWKKDEETHKEIIHIGDMVETEKTSHTFTNHTDKITKFLVIKQVLSGKNKSEIFRNEKIIDE